MTKSDRAAPTKFGCGSKEIAAGTDQSHSSQCNAKAVNAIPSAIEIKNYFKNESRRQMKRAILAAKSNRRDSWKFDLG